MREIKFRFYNKKLRKMSRVMGLGIIWESLCDEWGGPFDWVDVEKLQFTGLRDSKGVEIYEGDIVGIWFCSNIESKFKAMWSDKFSGFILQPKIYPFDTLGEVIEHFPSRVTVIGNIYETPERINE